MRRRTLVRRVEKSVKVENKRFRVLEPLGLALRSRQVKENTKPVQLRLRELGARLERFGQSVRQRLVNGLRETGAVERPDGFIEARDGREEITHGVEPRTAVGAGVRPRNDLERTASNHEPRWAPASGPETISIEARGNSSTAASGFAAAS